MREQERIYKREQEQQEEMARLREKQREQKRREEAAAYDRETEQVKALFDEMFEVHKADLDRRFALIFAQENQESQPAGGFMQDLQKQQEIHGASGAGGASVSGMVGVGARSKVAMEEDTPQLGVAQGGQGISKQAPDSWAQLQQRVQGAKPTVAPELASIQNRAQELMKTRQDHLNKVLRKVGARTAGAVEGAGGAIQGAAAAAPSTAPLGGIHHLRQLNLATESMMEGVESRTVEDVYAGKENINALSFKKPLNINTSFQMGIPDNGAKIAAKAEETGVVAGGVINSNVQNVNTNAKIKSGKFAKSHTELVRQELWPHTAISKKYMKRTAFDSLEFEGFVAGESKIIYNMLAKGDRDRGLGRLRVLTLISHWLCRSRAWPAVRCLFESIIDEVEQGEADWTDDFSGHETILPNLQQNNNTQGGDRSNKVEDRKKAGVVELYWCKGYQNGSCEKEAPHMAQIRPDEPMVPVLHICAACWNTSKKKREHPEGDPSCPSKK